MAEHTSSLWRLGRTLRRGQADHGDLAVSRRDVAPHASRRNSRSASRWDAGDKPMDLVRHCLHPRLREALVIAGRLMTLGVVTGAHAPLAHAELFRCPTCSIGHGACAVSALKGSNGLCQGSARPRRLAVAHSRHPRHPYMRRKHDTVPSGHVQLPPQDNGLILILHGRMMFLRYCTARGGGSWSGRDPHRRRESPPDTCVTQRGEMLLSKDLARDEQAGGNQARLERSGDGVGRICLRAQQRRVTFGWRRWVM